MPKSALIITLALAVAVAATFGAVGAAAAQPGAAIKGVMVKDKSGWLLRVKSSRERVKKGTYRLVEVPQHEYPDGLFVAVQGKTVDCKDKHPCIKVEAIEPAVLDPL